MPLQLQKNGEKSKISMSNQINFSAFHIPISFNFPLVSSAFYNVSLLNSLLPSNQLRFLCAVNLQRERKTHHHHFRATCKLSCTISMRIKSLIYSHRSAYIYMLHCNNYQINGQKIFSIHLCVRVRVCGYFNHRNLKVNNFPLDIRFK